MIGRIRELKSRKKLTEENLAKLASLPISTVKKLLAKVTKDPRISTLLRIAEALDTTVDYLVFGYIGSGKDQKSHPLLDMYDWLNMNGKKEALKRLDELSRLDEYNNE